MQEESDEPEVKEFDPLPLLAYDPVLITRRATRATSAALSSTSPPTLGTAPIIVKRKAEGAVEGKSASPGKRKKRGESEESELTEQEDDDDEAVKPKVEAEVVEEDDAEEEEDEEEEEEEDEEDEDADAIVPGKSHTPCLWLGCILIYIYRSCA